MDAGTYEYLADDLILASEEVVFGIGVLLKNVNERLIKNPGDISRIRMFYEKEVKKIAVKFEQDAKKWSNYGIADSYLIGIKDAQKQLLQNGLSSPVVADIKNGSSLIKHTAPTNTTIPIKITSEFTEYKNHIRFYNIFREAAINTWDGTGIQIIRTTDDLFRKIAIETGTSEFIEGNVMTRKQFSQRLLNNYAKAGLQSITYKNGAKHSLDTYCEMVGRTMSGRASLQGSLNAFQEGGYELVQITAHFRSCDVCAQFEGEILSIQPIPGYKTVDEAILDGLFHPNCKHGMSVYLEHTDKVNASIDYAERKLINDMGYEEAQKYTYQQQQRQRYNERQIRKYKRLKDVQLTDRDKKAMNDKVREWQKVQREHLNKNRYLNRNYAREQIS